MLALCSQHRKRINTQYIHSHCAIEVDRNLLIEGHPVSEHIRYQYQNGSWTMTDREPYALLRSYYCGDPQCLLEIVAEYGKESLRPIAVLAIDNPEVALQKMKADNISAPQLQEAVESLQNSSRNIALSESHPGTALKTGPLSKIPRWFIKS